MKRRLFILLAVIFSIMALFSGCVDTTNPSGNGNGGGGGGGDTAPEQEKVVKNITYNEQKLQIEWDALDGAERYFVNIDGREYETAENKYFFVMKKNETSIKVKAEVAEMEYNFNNTGYLVHYNTDWSDEYTYTFDYTDGNSDKFYFYVHAMVQRFNPSSDLKKILNIYIDEGNMYTEGDMYTNALFNYNGKEYIYRYISSIKTDIGEGVNTLREVLAVIDNVRTIRLDKLTVASVDNMAPEDSVKVFVDSGHYVGKMQEYKDNGYAFEIVSACASADEENFEENPYVRMFAIYRFTKGTEVLYASSYVKATITDVSPYIAINLISRIDDPESRYLSEQHFIVYEGDFAEFAEKMYQVNKG